MLYPNVLLEFGKFNVSQIIQNCHQLFSVDDICNCVEIWRIEHARSILIMLSEVFGDVDASELQCVYDDVADHEYIVDSEWADVRDDSLVCNMFMNDSNMSDINALLDESVQSNDDSMDISGIVHELAVEASQHIDIDMKEKR